MTDLHLVETDAQAAALRTGVRVDLADGTLYVTAAPAMLEQLEGLEIVDRVDGDIAHLTDRGRGVALRGLGAQPSPIKRGRR